ncbi:MAG TPA: hypothetical protein VE954_19560, partial [Oligoflexus sp.]|uniref:hypothetical protein n=1 Tax=Oligoflexus sp. TaxID=1971216 RepID=UPI002D3635F6
PGRLRIGRWPTGPRPMHPGRQPRQNSASGSYRRDRVPCILAGNPGRILHREVTDGTASPASWPATPAEFCIGR